MKTRIFSIVILLSASLLVSAQSLEKKSDKIYNNALSISLATLPTGNFQLNYERSINTTWAIKIGIGATFIDKDDRKKEGLNSEIYLKYYVLDKDREKKFYNIYFSPFIEYKNTSVTFYDEDTYMGAYNKQVVTYNSVGGGFLFGQYFVLGKRLVLDLYFGGGIRRNFSNDEDNSLFNTTPFQEGYNGIIGKIGLDIGFKF